MSKDLTVKILGDSKSLEAALGRSAKKSSSFGKHLETASKVGVAALGGLAFGAYKAVQAGSDLNEQISKSQQVFGKSAKAIQKWSDTTAEGIGISKTEALEAAGTFGNMLVPMGFARTKAADMSQSFVDLAGDMASFNNASPADTLEALRSGLSGETEPLRKYGVFLNQARIQQELMNEGIKKNVNDVTAAQKATATYNIIMKDTKDTQGDFKRTSGGLANQQRILTAELSDLAAELGTALLPIVKDVVGQLRSFTHWAKENQTAVKVLAGTIATFAAAIVTLNYALKALAVLQGTKKLLTGFGRGAAVATAETEGAAAATGAFGSTLPIIGTGLLLAARAYQIFGEKAAQTTEDEWAGKFATDQLHRSHARLAEQLGRSGKSVDGWKAVMNNATGQARHQAQVVGGELRFAHGKTADLLRGVVKTTNLEYAAEMDDVAKKARIAAGDTKHFGAATRAQYGHVARLAQITADLTRALNSVPSKTYVALVLSVTQNLRTEGLAPGMGPESTRQGPGGGYSPPRQPSGGGGGHKSSANINLHVDGKVLAQAVVRQDKVYHRQNGRGLFA